MASLRAIENTLTHEVFKHGLLMSQQVINNGLPSNKESKTRSVTTNLHSDSSEPSERHQATPRSCGRFM